MIHFKFVGIKDMHNIYYLGLSGERSLPFGLLVIYIYHCKCWEWTKDYVFYYHYLTQCIFLFIYASMENESAHDIVIASVTSKDSDKLPQLGILPQPSLGKQQVWK